MKHLGSLLPGTRRRASAERVVRAWRDDSLKLYPTIGLTPSRLLALLQAADGGQPQAQFELGADMLQRWPRLAAVEATRRLALTGLDWEIVPATAEGRSARERARAEQGAALCRRALARLERLREALSHLASALAHGLSVCELVWERGDPVDIVPVPHARLVGDPVEPWRIRVRTEDEPAGGPALDEQPSKWIVHQPRPVPGRPFEGGLLRASALLFLAQNLSFKDWLIFSQVAGMPIRVAQFDPGTPDADKRELLRMLEALNTDAVAVVGKNVDLRFIDAAKSESRPYAALQEYCNTEVTILWLGQSLTTDIRSGGSRAAAEVHDRVREDLLADDMAQEAASIRRGLLAPIVRSALGPDAPVPQFRRALVQTVDTRSLAETLAVAVNELGLPVSQPWVHASLGIPEPRSGEPVLAGRGGR